MQLPAGTALVPVPLPADDMPTVTVQSSFDWKFWLGAAAVAAFAWYTFNPASSGRRKRGRRQQTYYAT